MKTIEPTVESLANLRIEAEAWKVAYKALCAELVMNEMPVAKLAGYADRVQRDVVAFLQYERFFVSPGALAVAEECAAKIQHSVNWWHMSAEYAEKKRQEAEDRDAEERAIAAVESQGEPRQ